VAPLLAVLRRLHKQLLHYLFQFLDRQLLRIIEVLPVASGIPASKPVLPDIARTGANLAEVPRPTNGVKHSRRIGTVAFVGLTGEICLEGNPRGISSGRFAQAAADEMPVPQIALAKLDLCGPESNPDTKQQNRARHVGAMRLGDRSIAQVLGN